MTHEELISNVREARRKIEELNKECNLLQERERVMIKNYTDEHRKFHNGDVVNYTREKYKTPRKYIVDSHISFIETQNNGEQVLKIMYSIITANGYRPNGGWRVDEKELKKVE